MIDWSGEKGRSLGPSASGISEYSSRTGPSTKGINPSRCDKIPELKRLMHRYLAQTSENGQFYSLRMGKAVPTEKQNKFPLPKDTKNKRIPKTQKENHATQRNGRKRQKNNRFASTLLPRNTSFHSKESKPQVSSLVASPKSKKFGALLSRSLERIKKLRQSLEKKEGGRHIWKQATGANAKDFESIQRLKREQSQEKNNYYKISRLFVKKKKKGEGMGGRFKPLQIQLRRDSLTGLRKAEELFSLGRSKRASLGGQGTRAKAGDASQKFFTFSEIQSPPANPTQTQGYWTKRASNEKLQSAQIRFLDKKEKMERVPKTSRTETAKKTLEKVRALLFNPEDSRRRGESFAGPSKGNRRKVQTGAFVEGFLRLGRRVGRVLLVYC